MLLSPYKKNYCTFSNLPSSPPLPIVMKVIGSAYLMSRSYCYCRLLKVDAATRGNLKDPSNMEGLWIEGLPFSLTS